MKTPRLLVTLLFSVLLTGCTLSSANAGPHMVEVVIAYAEPIGNYSPLGFEARDRRYLANIYEPLVAFDRSFNFKTALAVSWGRVDDLTWEFRLREGVLFHDGRSLDAEDVLYSLESARDERESELASLLDTIESVEIAENGRIHIVTKSPDPLLLNRLTNVYIFPQDADLSFPVGTGPYALTSFEEDTLHLSRFDAYWGDAPYFERAALRYIADAEQRFSSAEKGEVHVLANVPPQFVSELQGAGLDLVDFPSLEVSYLMLNSATFEDEAFREVLRAGLGRDFAEELGGGYLLATDQYAASGIMGYDSEVTERAEDLEAALDARADLADSLSFTLDLPEGLQALGVMIAEDLERLDLDMQMNIFPTSEYEAQILSGRSQAYFFGWKYDLADSADFFESVVDSEGAFNGINYSNDEVDAWIEQAAQSLDEEERRALLGQITSELLGEGYIIPLFEAKLLYAVSPQVLWEPRLDGTILASEILENVVE